jgi:hypothetical protein
VEQLERILNNLPYKVGEFDISLSEFTFQNARMKERPLDEDVVKALLDPSDQTENPCQFKKRVDGVVIYAEADVDFVQRLNYISEFTSLQAYEIKLSDKTLLFFNETTRNWIRKYRSHEISIGDRLETFCTQKLQEVLFEQIDKVKQTKQQLDYDTLIPRVN